MATTPMSRNWALDLLRLVAVLLVIWHHQLGEEAVTLGMAGECVDDAAVAGRLAEYCQSLCDWSPITRRLLKRGMSRWAASGDMESQLRYEVSNIRRAFGSEDGQEARRAFLEKRKPVFTGR